MPCRSGLPFQPAVLEALVSTGYLALRDLLSLRGTCKQLFTGLTGALPAYLEYRLPERYPSTAVRPLHCVAGPKVQRLRVIQVHLSCLMPFQHLQELHLDLVEGLRHNKQFPRLHAVNFAPLTPLPHLHSLSVNSGVGRTVQAVQLRQLLSLRALSLTNVMSSLLPPSLSALGLQASPEVLIPASAQESFVVYGGSLQMLRVHMPLFGNDPRSLRRVPSLQPVVELQLQFHFREPTRSRWCPGLPCLQILHIYHLYPCNYLRPSWDLCTCTSLAELHLHIHASSKLCLRGIVRAQVVTVDLQGIASGQERCSLDCGSWSLVRAEVTYARHAIAGFGGRFPLCVSDAVGALMCTHGGPPAVTVNGTTPAQAAAAAASTGQCACHEALEDSDEWEL